MWPIISTGCVGWYPLEQTKSQAVCYPNRVLRAVIRSTEIGANMCALSPNSMKRASAYPCKEIGMNLTSRITKKWRDVRERCVQMVLNALHTRGELSRVEGPFRGRSRRSCVRDYNPSLGVHSIDVRFNSWTGCSLIGSFIVNRYHNRNVADS